MKQQKGRGETASGRFLKPVAFGTVAGLGVMVLCFCFLSMLMTFRDIPHVFIEPLASTVAAVGSFCSGYAGAKLLREKGILVGTACGGLIFLLIALSGTLVGGMEYNLTLLLKFCTILLAAAVGGVLGVNLKKKRK